MGHCIGPASKISISVWEGIIKKKNSYERRAYESVDKKKTKNSWQSVKPFMTKVIQLVDDILGYFSKICGKIIQVIKG